jgi:hypothetical protein
MIVTPFANLPDADHLEWFAALEIVSTMGLYAINTGLPL